MTELEQHVQRAIAAGVLDTMRFEALKGEEVRLWMEIQGEREKDSTWTIRARMGDETAWKREGLTDAQLLTAIKYFHSVFLKLGRERPRA